MRKICEVLNEEFKREAATTRKLLERVPADKFGWKPHEKSMTLLELARHIGDIPSWMRVSIHQDELDMGGMDWTPAEVESTEDLLAHFDKNVEDCLDACRDVENEVFQEHWRLRTGDDVHFEGQKGGVVRGFVMSHMVHHRGQLSVYLRLLDVPLPSIYGPTADEPSF